MSLMLMQCASAYCLPMLRASCSHLVLKTPGLSISLLTLAVSLHANSLIGKRKVTGHQQLTAALLLQHIQSSRHCVPQCCRKLGGCVDELKQVAQKLRRLPVVDPSLPVVSLSLIQLSPSSLKETHRMSACQGVMSGCCVIYFVCLYGLDIASVVLAMVLRVQCNNLLVRIRSRPR